MLDSKFLFTLVGLIITVFAICNTNMSPSINEGFWGNSGAPRGVKVIRDVYPKNGQPFSMPNNSRLHQQTIGHDKFVSNPSFQGILSPRFSNTQYGANIKYNMPSYNNLASPCDPLSMGNMVKEGYCNKGGCGSGCGGGCGVAKCGKGGVSIGGETSLSAPQALSSDPNYQSALEQIHNSDHTIPVIPSGSLPVGDMTTLNSLGVDAQPIVYDRYIYANQKSRLYAQADPIRGDLPIKPNVGNWFNVSVTPGIDLNPGAMNVMGGATNETTQAIGDLINVSSGGYDNTIAGMNMSNQFSTMTSAAGGDVQISAFA